MEIKTGKADKILIVDDDPGVRTFLERFLKQKGFEDIQSVAAGKDAISIVEKEDVKLVLLDIRLPEMDGLEVLKIMKKFKPELGVIMITGFVDEAIAKQTLKEGAFDYIMKPFDLAYLELSVLTKITME